MREKNVVHDYLMQENSTKEKQLQSPDFLNAASQKEGEISVRQFCNLMMQTQGYNFDRVWNQHWTKAFVEVNILRSQAYRPVP